VADTLSRNCPWVRFWLRATCELNSYCQSCRTSLALRSRYRVKKIPLCVLCPVTLSRVKPMYATPTRPFFMLTAQGSL